MINFVYILIWILAAYLVLTLLVTYLAQSFPRNPVNEKPDWGKVFDTRIETADGGFLEVWKIDPDMPARGVVVFAHGWGRNRDRMVKRAGLFGRMGFTTVIHSARDHGGSSPQRFMNAVRFAEDIESVLNWLGEKVILYGHSAGSIGAIIAAERNPGRISSLFLEASYAYTREGMMSLYRWVNPVFAIVFGRMILFWMSVLYGSLLDEASPARLAPLINIPVMIIHGEKDKRFPLDFAFKLRDSFQPGIAQLFVAEGVGHSDSSTVPGYEHAVKDFLKRHSGEKGQAGRSAR